jgi:hypothetical protein
LTFSRLKMNRAGRALAFFARRQQKEQERRSQRTNPDIAPSPQRAPQPTRSRPQDRSPTLTPATPQQGMRTAEESSPAAIMTASLPPRFDAATARQQAGLPEPPPRYEASPYEASPYPTPPPPRRGAVPPVPEM